MKPPRRASNPSRAAKPAPSRPSKSGPPTQGRSSSRGRDQDPRGGSHQDARGGSSSRGRGPDSRGGTSARGRAPESRGGSAPRGRDQEQRGSSPRGGRGSAARGPSVPRGGPEGRPRRNEHPDRDAFPRQEQSQRAPAPPSPPPARPDRPGRTFESAAQQGRGPIKNERPQGRPTFDRSKVTHEPVPQERPPVGEAPAPAARAVYEERVWGRHAVLEHLRSGSPINRLFVLTTAQGLNREFFELAQEQGIPVVRSQKERLDYLASGGAHQGIVAQLGARAFATTDDVVEAFQAKGRAGLLLMLSGVQDPGNLGAILRTAEGAGVQGVLLSAMNSCGLTSTVSKISAGADAHLPIARADRLERILEPLKESGVQIVVTLPVADTLYYQVDFTRPTVLVLGGEESGVDTRLARLATHRVAIPMMGKIESLNVSAAAAALLYEAVRQRTK